jgi:hypothetical protein
MTIDLSSQSGYTGSVEINIDRIDTVEPSITNITRTPTTITGGPVTVTVDAVDSGDIGRSPS